MRLSKNIEWVCQGKQSLPNGSPDLTVDGHRDRKLNFPASPMHYQETLQQNQSIQHVHACESAALMTSDHVDVIQ